MKEAQSYGSGAPELTEDRLKRLLGRCLTHAIAPEFRNFLPDHR